MVRVYMYRLRVTSILARHAVQQKLQMSYLARPNGSLFSKILVANRGEIACRIQRSAHKLNMKTVTVYSDADANAQHVKMADESYRLGPPPASESYLMFDEILRIAKESGAEAIHPGYGFLSENAEFAKACKKAGIEFIGPPVPAIEAMGSKSASKDIMIKAGVPVTPGYHGEDQSFEIIKAESKKIGYPVLIKAVLGGGGKGMRIVENELQLQESVDACVREAKASFASTDILVEKYLTKPRHVELQVFGDKYGNVIHLFERDCSVQRRHQKVLEEAPAPFLSPELRHKMGAAAVAAAKAVGYVGAGTVEFLLDEDESFYFMEMNTRLQVEHPVTEYITKQDLVELQLKVASGQTLPIKQEDLKIHGHAIEARIYAENPYNNFLPGSGQLHHIRLPATSENVRVDTGIIEKDTVSIFYDPMIAKLIVHGRDRKEALDGLIKALKQYQIIGLSTNIEFVTRTVAHPEFIKGGVDTSFLNKFGDDVLEPYTSVPDHAQVLAAMSLLLKQNSTKYLTVANSPWSKLTHFRSQETLTRSFQLSFEEAELNFNVTCFPNNTYEISINNGTPIPVSGFITADGDYEFKVQNHLYKGTAVVFKQDVHIFCNDDSLRYKYKFTIPSPAYDGASTGNQLQNTIITPMPGKIIKLLVQNGQDVKADQPLIIMEAMKMEHVIRAARDGKVKDVNCAEGEQIGDGQILIELDAKDDKK